MSAPAGPAAFDLARYQDPLTIQRVLYAAKRVAVVGLSPNELRASYFVGYYLRRHGYTVIPVNPKEAEILGQKSYKSLSDVPGPIDIVNVFRRSEHLPQIAEDAIAVGARVLWTQLGVFHPAAAQRAETAGLAVVQDRCIKVEHRRLGLPRQT